MQLRIYDTADDQLRAGYDATHYLGVSVSSAGVIAIKESGTERGRISGGVLAWGTTVTTGASAGDVVVLNTKSLRGVTAAGTGTLNIARLDANNLVQIADAGAGCYALVGVAASPGAGAAALAGAVVVSGTDLVYYDSTGARRKLTGTSF